MSTEKIKYLSTPVLTDAKIYIVDDQSQNVQLLENILELAGYHNVWSSTIGLDLLKKVEGEKPDILLLDLMMPGISGLEILEKIKSEINDEVTYPVIVLTADMNPETKKECLALGASDFLTKPFDINEVLLRIKNHLYTKHLMDRLQNQNEFLEIEVSKRTQELNNAKNEAEKNEKRFRQLFESNLDLVHLFLAQESGPSNFIEVNQASERILGYSKEEMQAFNFLDIHLGKSKEEVQVIYQTYLDQSNYDFESTVKTKKGDIKYLEIKGTLIRIEDKLAIMTISRDITDRKIQEQLVLDQNKKLREIAWIQSHVVRAPVARAMGLMQVLEDFQSEASPELMEMLGYLKDSLLELDEVILDIDAKTNQCDLSKGLKF